MPITLISIDNPGVGTHVYTLGYTEASSYASVSNSVITLLVAKR